MHSPSRIRIFLNIFHRLGAILICVAFDGIPAVPLAILLHWSLDQRRGSPRACLFSSSSPVAVLGFLNRRILFFESDFFARPCPRFSGT
ncbi:hypothetical protein OF83DRAFT_842436 [Amylostereum chailletii]|nr:hypothetical protein OF83DRAFT_842436 [Amylostereum chailletii]